MPESSHGVWSSEALIMAEKQKSDLIKLLEFMQRPSVGVTLDNRDVKHQRIADTQAVLASHDILLAYLRDGVAQTERGTLEGPSDSVNV